MDQGGEQAEQVVGEAEEEADEEAEEEGEEEEEEAEEEEEDSLFPAFDFDECAAPKAARQFCTECDRPQSSCMCASYADPVETRTRVIILMHPLELKRKMSTAKIVQRALGNCITLVHRQFKRFLVEGDDKYCPELVEALVRCAISARAVGCPALWLDNRYLCWLMPTN